MESYLDDLFNLRDLLAAWLVRQNKSTVQVLNRDYNVNLLAEEVEKSSPLFATLLARELLNHRIETLDHQEDHQGVFQPLYDNYDVVEILTSDIAAFEKEQGLALD